MNPNFVFDPLAFSCWSFDYLELWYIYVLIVAKILFFLATHFPSHVDLFSLSSITLKMSWKITFTARYVACGAIVTRSNVVYHLCFYSKNIGSSTLVLLQKFDFETSKLPLPSKQEAHPVVWKYNPSFFIVYLHRINPCQDFEISEDRRYSSS